MPDTEETLFDQIEADKKKVEAWPDWCKKLTYFAGIKPEFSREEQN